MADDVAAAGGLGSGVCRDEAGPDSGVCTCGRPTERISVTVKPTTGGQFAVTATSDDSVDYLKLLVSQKLKVPKERICLLYRNRPLRDGTLEANQVVHGCQLILLPSVESGLMSHRPEQSVMQALENLKSQPAPQRSEPRAAERHPKPERYGRAAGPSGPADPDGATSGCRAVTEFLSGKAPLNLTVRLGEHMMLIQLQLSPAQVAARRNLRPPATAAASRPPASPASPASPGSPAAPAAAERRQRRCPHQRPRGHDDPASGLRSQLDTRALTEASRNLTRTLKQLSSEVLTGGTDTKDQDGPTVLLSSPSAAPGAASGSAPLRPHPGAIIESMHHHGKGVYSGTFSGTLNPSLQDRMGRPKRDISTIIHILNDLLCASPQYRGEDGGAQSKPAPGAPGPQEPAQPPAEPTTLDENQATRGKVERLKLVLEERRQRRRQRRTQRSAPYTTSWPPELEAPSAGSADTEASPPSADQPRQTALRPTRRRLTAGVRSERVHE
ncbi:LOW QUALITY PROTEIN: midnolin homolog [Pollicipes pollicipes]|uniref:LOW QUALITY PROTEIN: midnolin homolog n=1 Tax=Pollicipes pollicipes TaxID=41117 RepID=UPI001884E760|nr:LOW QUALITY PROTEIN: midnolin homolog [Pollicipes pollicipes]